MSARQGLGLRQRRPAREGMCGAPARFNSGSPRTPTGGPGTERLLDAQPALAARTLSCSTSPAPGRADKDTTHVSSKCCSKVASISSRVASFFPTGVMCLSVGHMTWAAVSRDGASKGTNFAAASALRAGWHHYAPAAANWQGFCFPRGDGRLDGVECSLRREVCSPTDYSEKSGQI